MGSLKLNLNFGNLKQIVGVINRKEVKSLFQLTLHYLLFNLLWPLSLNFSTTSHSLFSAGPGFEYRSLGDVSLAANNVQCIHTSNTYGSTKRNCTQNWNMGVCGYAQVGAMPFPKGSHGLCPYFYTAAFKHDFIAWKNIYGCYSTRAVTEHPENFKMGYMETRKRYEKSAF